MEEIKSKTSELKGQAGQFYKFTTSRPVAILMVVIGVVVFGWISYKQLPVNLMPDISYPSLTVRTEYTGTAPEEIETTISRPVEQALGVVNNLVSISSISKAGQSDVKLEFTWDTEMNQATADVREKLDQVFLPQEANRPLILRFDPSLDPIMRLGLYGEASLIYLRYLADEEIKRILETVEGVAAVKVKGGLEEEIRVELNEQQLTLIGIDIQQIKNRLSQENVNLAGGNLKEGQTEYLVRTLNEFKSVEEIKNVVIGNWNGREIKVGDVANVSRTFKDREIITRLVGKESVEIEIFKEADANIIAVAERVKNRVFGTAAQQAFVKQLSETKKKLPEKKKTPSDEDKQKKDQKSQGGQGGQRNRKALIARQMTNFISHQLPQGLKIDLLSDRSVFIQNSVDEVKNTAVLGGILAVVVLFIFLRNMTATMIVGIAIPISIVATFAPMKSFGLSLNIMSLGGLALGIGMLVDNSIVVLENIARCRQEGDGLIQATVRGVGEVGGAVFASTLTTVAVFFPIVFVQGVAGQIFGNLALTVVFSLFASLAVALFLIPMLSSRQSSRFVQGIQTDKLFKKHIFFFSTQEDIDVLLSGGNEQGFLRKVTSGLLVLLKTSGLIFWKSLKAFAALLIAGIKHFSILFAVLLTPVLGLLKTLSYPILKLLKKNSIQFKLSEWTTQYASNADFWRIRYVREIWPDYLINKSAPALFDDMQKIRTRFKEFSWKGKIGQVVLAPFKVTLILFKFVFQFFLELIFRLFHFFFMITAVFIKGFYLISKMLLSTPVGLFLAAFNWAYGRLEATYPKILQSSLKNSGVVLGSVGLLFLFSIFVIGPRLGSELIPEVHQREFNVEITLPVGTPVEQTDLKIADIQQYLRSLPGVKRVSSVSGTDKTANASSEEGEHTAKIMVTLNRPGDRTPIEEPESGIATIPSNGQFAAVAGDIRTNAASPDLEKEEAKKPVRYKSAAVVDEEEVVETIRQHMQNFPGIRWKISRPVLFSFKTPVEVEIRGYTLQKLQEISTELEEKMTGIPGITDIKSNIQRGNPEVQIIYNRPLIAKYNLNVRDVASIVRNKVRGDVATEFKERDRKIDILVRLREEDRESIYDLRRLTINPGAVKAIPLEAVAQINVQEGPSEIRRVDQQRTALVSANIHGRSLSEVGEDIFALLQTIDMPDDFTYTLAGQNEEMETSLNSLKLALALAIFLVYIVMASQFESIIHPFVIIFTIPLALIGVILFLFLFDIPLSVVVFLGMIMLAGIVVNNAIVLVDYINKLRDRGMEKMQAIVEACKIRLRPIMMTTATTVLGLLPMALGLGDGAEIRTPMAITVIVGLMTSTILTLVIIPTVYSMVDRKS